MASWIHQSCMELLQKINQVPMDDKRESSQLTLIMAGIANINKEVMRRAALNIRTQLGQSSAATQTTSRTNPSTPPPAPAAKPVVKAEKPVQAAKPPADDIPDLDDFDAFDEELDMIEQTLIRSIGD